MCKYFSTVTQKPQVNTLPSDSRNILHTAAPQWTLIYNMYYHWEYGYTSDTQLDFCVLCQSVSQYLPILTNPNYTLHYLESELCP